MPFGRWLWGIVRPLRLEHPGAIYHVAARGNERRAVFHNNGDRERVMLVEELVACYLLRLSSPVAVQGVLFENSSVLPFRWFQWGSAAARRWGKPDL